MLSLRIQALRDTPLSSSTKSTCIACKRFDIDEIGLNISICCGSLLAATWLWRELVKQHKYHATDTYAEEEKVLIMHLKSILCYKKEPGFPAKRDDMNVLIWSDTLLHCTMPLLQVFSALVIGLFSKALTTLWYKTQNAKRYLFHSKLEKSVKIKNHRQLLFRLSNNSWDICPPPYTDSRDNPFKSQIFNIFCQQYHIELSTLKQLSLHYTKFQIFIL